MRADTFEMMRNGRPTPETPFVAAWEERHGHRWVLLGGKYYPAQDAAKVRAQLAAKRLGQSPQLLPAPIGVAR